MKKNKKLAIIIAFVLILSPIAGALDAPEPQAEAALLIDLDSGETLYEKAINEKLFPASLTKIMTFLVISDLDPNLDELVTVEEYMFEGLSEFGTTANIKNGEQISVRDLLECMLIISANEAANILAIHCFGSLDAFVIAMNSKADALGCRSTHFMNPHGLHDEEHYTTASDMRIIAVEALKNPLFLEIISTDMTTQDPTNLTEKGRTLANTNSLITKYRTADYFYPDAIGGKTGFTTPAGNCLVAIAKRGDFYLLSIVMKAFRDPETNLAHSYTDTIDLFNWGFENFDKRTLLQSTEPVYELPVTLAQDTDYVVLAPSGDISAIVPKDLADEDIERVIDVPESIEAPVTKGDIYGKLTLKAGDREFGSVDLIALSGAERSALLDFTKSTGDTLTNPSVRQGIFITIGIILTYIAIMIFINVRRRRKKARLLARMNRQRERDLSLAQQPATVEIDRTEG